MTTRKRVVLEIPSTNYRVVGVDEGVQETKNKRSMGGASDDGGVCGCLFIVGVFLPLSIMLWKWACS